MLKLTKRKKFVLTSLILFLGFLIMIFREVLNKELMIGIMIVLTYLLSAWSLSEGLGGIEWFSVLILPTLFTAGIGFFYFFLSSSFLAKILAVVFFGLGTYILLLVSNIFSVSAIRTIQLLRSAQVVGFLFILIISFFIYTTILTFKLPFWFNFVLVFFSSLFLVFPGLWSVTLEETFSKRVLLYTLVISLIQSEIALAFSFWPVNTSVGSLALVSSLYLSLGLFQYHLNGRLFPKVIKEYFLETIFVFLIIFLTTKWGG